MSRCIFYTILLAFFKLSHGTVCVYALQFNLMCIHVSVLPDGYADDPLQWLPQFELADGSSPAKKSAAHNV